MNENIYRNIVNGCRLGYSSSQPVASEGLLRDTVWKMKRLLLAAVTVGGGAPQDVNVEYPTYPWDVTTCLQTSAVSWLHWNRLLSVLKGRTQKNRIATCFLFCQFTIYICKMSKFLYQKKSQFSMFFQFVHFYQPKKPANLTTLWILAQTVCGHVNGYRLNKWEPHPRHVDR